MRVLIPYYKRRKLYIYLNKYKYYDTLYEHLSFTYRVNSSQQFVGYTFIIGTSRFVTE